ncbi:mCG1030451, isoform CRA_a [Mus musculus]|nr:mCG1030451, isoform CRA_a [Mus musculus]EDL20341.1 mCG1030451, isoform CRA_a [Mus musculus]
MSPWSLLIARIGRNSTCRSSPVKMKTGLDLNLGLNGSEVVNTGAITSSHPENESCFLEPCGYYRPVDTGFTVRTD